MRQHYHGFVLLIVLVFLQLFALLSAEYLWHKTTFKQHIKLQMAVIKAHDQALYWLTQLARQNPRCDNARYSSKFLLDQPESWWQAHACYQLRELHVYFLREDLMSDSCTAVSSQPLLRAHYSRHTIFVAGMAGAILQETVASNDQAPVDCKQPVNIIAPGRQTLRWLR